MNNTIGQTIWQQITLGTKMACGARDAVTIENGVMFTVLRSRATKIQVTLDPSDTYTVKFIKITKKFNAVTIEEKSDVYVDMLNEVVYRMCNK